MNQPYSRGIETLLVFGGASEWKRFIKGWLSRDYRCTPGWYRLNNMEVSQAEGYPLEPGSNLSVTELLNLPSIFSCL